MTSDHDEAFFSYILFIVTFLFPFRFFFHLFLTFLDTIQMELPHIGQHCSVKTCNRLGMLLLPCLPLRITHCNSILRFSTYEM